MSSRLILIVGAFLILLLSGSVILASDDVDVFQVQSSSSYSGDCGVANENGKIYAGDDETEPNEYPWQALLLVFIEYRSASGKKVVAPSEFCGGTLIDDRWILTSANCLTLQTGQKFVRVDVFLGVEIVPSVNQKSYQGYEIYIHPEWNPASTQTANVALIQLSTVVDYTQYIRPICLASSSEPDYINHFNQPVIVTGASNTTVSYDETSASATAGYRTITTSVVSNSQCDAVHLMTDRMMCTAGVANDSGLCSYIDQGNPLMFQQTDGTFKQIGILSFTPTTGSVCQTAGDPLAYTRLSSYSKWIEDVVSSSPSSVVPVSGTSSAILFLFLIFSRFSK